MKNQPKMTSSVPNYDNKGELPSFTSKSDTLPYALTQEDLEKLKRQNSRLVSEFQAKNLEQNAQKYWDLFYKRNSTKFFKDRHWTTREFYELLERNDNNDQARLKILEIGCGVGNLIFPLLQETNVEIYACDFSPRAVEFVRNHELFQANKLTVFQADVTKDNLSDKTGVEVDVVTVVFVLSALHPNKFKSTVENLYSVLRAGGLVLIRDYGVYDMAQIRFKPGHKISENFYMRQDGTTTYFFKTELLRELFINAGFEEIVCCYVTSRTVNKKEEVDVPRTFVQAKFRKPLS